MVDSLGSVAADHGRKPRDVVQGLDTLRFVTAMWVAFSHGARFPIERVMAADTPLHKLLYLVNNTTFNGTAAVAVFFLISGFVIHRGNLQRKRVKAVPFWIRRGVRIGIPLVIVVIAAHLLGPDYVAALDRVLWSVYAELIYYALYPLILPVLIRFGTGKVLTASMAVTLLLIASKPSEVYLWAFGDALTWLFCAPLWLMGCFLAEHRSWVAKLSTRFSVWVFRAGAIAYCYGSTIAATHLGSRVVGYTWTIWLFGIFCVFWLDAEMRSGTGKAPVELLERFGLAGYSLYLTHRFALTFLDDVLQDFPPAAAWALTLGAVLLLTWAFYRLIEWPSHLAARRLGRVRRSSNAVRDYGLALR